MFNTGPSSGIMTRQKKPMKGPGMVGQPPDSGFAGPVPRAMPMPMTPPGGLRPSMPPTMGPGMGGTMPIPNGPVNQGPIGGPKINLGPFGGPGGNITMPIPLGGPTDQPAPPLGTRFGGTPNTGPNMPPDSDVPMWKRYIMMNSGM